MSTAQDAQLPQDDESRLLLAAFEACRAEELAAADRMKLVRIAFGKSDYGFWGVRII